MGRVDLHGRQRRKINLKGIHYGTSHGRNGVFCQLSCMTLISAPDAIMSSSPSNAVNGVGGTESTFYGTLQLTQPLVSRNMGSSLVSRLVSILQNMS